MSKNRHSTEKARRIAKDGFKNEKAILEKFENWENDKDAQQWLESMGYDLSSIVSLKALTKRQVSAILRKKHGKGIRINLRSKKTDGRIVIVFMVEDNEEESYENMSLKLVSVGKEGFNSTERGSLDKYKDKWNIPDDVFTTLCHFTGQLPPYKDNTRDERRMYFDEFEPDAVEAVIEFFEKNKRQIIADVFTGHDEFAVKWIIIAKRQTGEWKLLPIEAVVDHFCSGVVELTSRGNLYLGHKMSIQRKGGDNGGPYAIDLQFKFRPLRLFEIDA